MDLDDDFAQADALYDSGDYAGAFECFLRLAHQGDPSAMTRVALMYYFGDGVAASFEQSLKWDLRAAELGHRPAMFSLGLSFRNKGDARRAKFWFEKAIDAGDGDAALELAKMYLVSDKEAERVKAFLRLALQSDDLSAASRAEATELLAEFDGVAPAGAPIRPQ